MIQHLNIQSVNPKRVVVLGSGGFVGQKLINNLKDLGIKTRGIRSSEMDLSSADSVPKLRAELHSDDTVILVSAITPDKAKDIAALMKNLRMAEHVAAAISELTLAQMIYISSDAVFTENLPLILETTLASPTMFHGMLHGLMHLNRETMLTSVLEKTKTPYLILRPCSIYGKEDTHNSYGPNRFIRTAIKEKKISIFGQGEEKRPHLYIEDFIAVLREALKWRTTGALNVTPGESVSFGWLAQQIVKLVNNGTTIEFLPRSNEITHKHFDPSALLCAFPQIRFTSLERGLQEMVNQSV